MEGFTLLLASLYCIQARVASVRLMLWVIGLHFPVSITPLQQEMCVASRSWQGNFRAVSLGELNVSHKQKHSKPLPSCSVLSSASYPALAAVHCLFEARQRVGTTRNLDSQARLEGTPKEKEKRRRRRMYFLFIQTTRRGERKRSVGSLSCSTTLCWLSLKKTGGNKGKEKGYQRFSASVACVLLLSSQLGQEERDTD